MQEHTDTTAEGRDLLLEELVYLWNDIPWWHRRKLVLAIKFNEWMKRIATMRKGYAGYIVLALILVGATGLVISFMNNSTVGVGAFAAMCGATAIFVPVYLVWRYLK